MYNVQINLFRRARKADISLQQLADLLGEPRSTAANQFSGRSPLDDEKRKIVESFITEVERDNEEARFRWKGYSRE